MRFPKALGLLFIYLRLTGQIDWSFWLVTAPIWIDFVFALLELYLPKLEAWAKRKQEELERELQELEKP